MIRAVEFRGPDRFPMFHGVLPAAFLVHGQALRDLLCEFPSDFGGDPQNAWKGELPPDYRVGTHTDAWGTVWQVEQEGMIGIVKDYPIKSWDDADRLKFPPVPGDEVWEAHRKEMSRPDRDYYAFGWGVPYFERLQQLRGYENLMMDLATDEPALHKLMDRMVDWYVEGAEKSVQTGCDGIHFSDDWGTQSALMISPDAWRKWFKPRYARMFEPAKRAGKHVWFHTDGYTLPIFSELKDIGCDVINPQQTIIGIEEVGQKWAGKLAFRTDFDRQHVLPHGTRQEIRDHVKRVIDNMGTPAGGLILHGEIAPDVPLENIRYMLEGCVEFGDLSQ